jgi:hypothetical protein
MADLRTLAREALDEKSSLHGRTEKQVEFLVALATRVSTALTAPARLRTEPPIVVFPNGRLDIDSSETDWERRLGELLAQRQPTVTLETLTRELAGCAPGDREVQDAAGIIDAPLRHDPLKQTI